MFFVFVLAATSVMANAHDNVVHQAYYALDQSANGTSSKTIGGNYAGDWNWLTSDGSYSTVRGWFGCNSSDWAVNGDSCPQLAGWVSFYSNPWQYGYINSYSPQLNFYGRGGQCVYFVNLVLYRAGAYGQLPNLPTMWVQSISISNVQPGDVLQRYNVPGQINHVAIAVQVYKTNGVVTSVDVVDSNWITDYGANMEIIGRHNISGSTLQQFRVWRGYN